MKAIIGINLAVLWLLLACFPSSNSSPVRDVEGNELRQGEYYYVTIVTGLWPSPGLTLQFGSGGHRCPFEVIYRLFSLPSGSTPVSAWPANSSSVIQTETDLNLEFPSYPLQACTPPNVWKITPAGGESYVTTGGVFGNPGPQTIRNWFKIAPSPDQPVGPAYKFQYCPDRSLCGGDESCEDTLLCEDVGVVGDTGRLVLGGEPFSVVFERVVARDFKPVAAI